MELLHSYNDRKSEGSLKMFLYHLFHQKFHMDWSAIKTRLHGATLLLSLSYLLPSIQFL